MNVVYHAFTPHRPLAQYRGHTGHESNGLLLTPAAFDALADATNAGRPCEYEVVGEYVRDDGWVFLDLATTRAYIESATSYLHLEGRLRLVCPECEGRDGKHGRTCERR